MKHFASTLVLLLLCASSAVGQNKVVQFDSGADEIVLEKGDQYTVEGEVSLVEYPFDGVIKVHFVVDGVERKQTIYFEGRTFAAKSAVVCPFGDPTIEFTPATMVSATRYEFNQDVGTAERGAADFTVTATYYTSATTTTTGTPTVVWFQYDTTTAGAKLVAIANFTDPTVAGSQCRATQTLLGSNVQVAAANNVPVFTSTPVTTATVNVPYTSTFTADDADGDPTTFTMPTGPGFLALSGNIVSGTPGPSDVGSHPVVVRVSDGTDTIDQSYTLVVSAAPATDTDGDGVPDSSDNCPSVANPGQEDFDGDGQGDVCDADDDNDNVDDVNDAFPMDPTEWVDTDGDGVGNNADTDDDGDGQSDGHETTCGSNPLDASSLSSDIDSDGVPDCVDTDDDGDGVADTTDNCPTVANADQADSDGDGIGDVCDPQDNGDDDGDGVENHADQCPNTPPGTAVTADGCPVVAANQPAVIDCPGFQSTYEQGEVVNTPSVCTATDPEDGDISGSIVYTVYDVPGNLVSPFFGTTPTPGIYRINVSVTDSGGLRAERNYALTVSGPPPVVTITCIIGGPVNPVEGDAIEYSVVCTRSDGGSVTYDLNIPSWMNFRETGNTITFFGTAIVGTWEINLSASGGGVSEDTSFTFTVLSGTTSFLGCGYHRQSFSTLTVHQISGVVSCPGVSLVTHRITGNHPANFDVRTEGGAGYYNFSSPVAGNFSFKIEFFDADNVRRSELDFNLSYASGVNTEDDTVPGEFALSGNYPNPFNPKTTIRFETPAFGKVQLIVVDQLGRQVYRGSDEFAAGKSEWQFDASGLPSGVYQYILSNGTDVRTGSMTLVK